MRKTIALAVAAVALAGCGVLPGQQGGGGEEQQPPAATPEQVTSATPERAPQQTAQPDSVIATREASVGAGDMYGKARADITALKRQGKTLTLNWTITATDGKVNVHNGMGTAPLDFTVSAVSLIDPVNAKRYRTARNGTGEDAECVCSGTQGQFLEKDEASTLYAVFAAPPADVTKLNIEMPMIGVITDVPIS
ncbi:hypothetical protein SAMN05444920_103727 [Nonomuraea solani]|uniref:DUF4352 domain-containing protein n=1 Tax=Nonomuraea solani TaxID=1144553 RepID=A0A1H6BXC8_9ACTN|nr:hypothetical protein [Nonomuraea solani]SEG65348.1 hypothetical protein SAMN05444920_103727 [Nonomuraea solani]